MRFTLSILSIAVFASFGFAQTKTITNADLEKFRTKRLKAEKELRENYRQLGFPSPEEMERQRLASARDLERRSARYRSVQAERRRAAAVNPVPSSDFVVVYPQSSRPQFSPYYFYGGVPFYYGNGYRNRYINRYRRFKRRGPGYISNPIIRNNWLRQSAPMRRTYRTNRTNRGTRLRTRN
ncbi:MAG: hypothetical protein HKN33_15345 [Pyrinomonadaceae bacterium]|nr:hypothetical protein [Pyrinomonadaceae bacterium]